MTNFITDFPRGVCDITQKEDGNPAIQLFGRRFTGEQQVVELLSEFLLVLASQKEIREKFFDDSFPAWDDLQEWDFGDVLNYYPQPKLNLKLFSFLGSSRLETRHVTHRQHCQDLWISLKNKIYADEDQKDDVLITLSNLFLGFWGNGAQRTWCAQNFLPFCKGVLAGELIWNETAAKKIEGLTTWRDVLVNFQTLFTQNQHRFLARGGELLYLQLCNALRQKDETIRLWLHSTRRDKNLLPDEQYPQKLFDALKNAVSSFFAKTPNDLNELAEFIDHQMINETTGNSEETEIPSRKASCGWCPEESWREGYLFAVELSRILQAQIDIMETVELLQIACAMQLMRSLAAQCYRHRPNIPQADGLNYRMFFSEIEENSRKRKDISQQSLADINLAIHSALRLPELLENIPASERANIYKDADNRYGHKLFNRIGKTIGLIIPRRGGKARFVLTDNLLRFFVISLVPTQRMTLDHFKRSIASHFGFVFEEKELLQSPDWANRREQLDLNAEEADFLEKMLEASGMLVKLSDSCSMVKNPFYKETAR